jgi:hypothetical protein
MPFEIFVELLASIVPVAVFMILDKLELSTWTPEAYLPE